MLLLWANSSFPAGDLRFEFYQVANHGVVPAPRIEPCWPRVQNPCLIGRMPKCPERRSSTSYLHVSGSCSICAYACIYVANAVAGVAETAHPRFSLLFATLAWFNHVLNLSHCQVQENILGEYGTNNVTKKRMPGKRLRGQQDNK